MNPFAHIYCVIQFFFDCYWSSPKCRQQGRKFRTGDASVAPPLCLLSCPAR